jgi:hypothetical protein
VRENQERADTSNSLILDAFPPPAMAERMENVGVKKANGVFPGEFVSSF